jgi:phenylpyruvate tautomerase PptA (4-oxalocrotonate tautomerase family)
MREVVMTIVTVEMWDIYTTDQKKQLVKDITEAFVKVGTVANEVNIILRQNPRSCWAQGGRLYDDFEIPQGA